MRTNNLMLVPPRKGQRQKSTVLKQFNNGKPFQVVEIWDEQFKNMEYGVLNEEHVGDTACHVWRAKNIRYEQVDKTQLRAVNVPHPPVVAYEPFEATIGGIGKHWRWKVIMARKMYKKACALFVSNIFDQERFKVLINEKIRPFGFCNFEFKFYKQKCTTIVDIPNHKNITVVAAALHCAGHAAIPYTDEMASFGNLGIERYDRSEHTWWNQNQHTAGPLRDTHKWNYGYVPENWKSTPFTWLSMASNFDNCFYSDLKYIPFPLRNYVIDKRFETKKTSTKRSTKRWKNMKTKNPCVTSRLTASQNIQLLICSYWTFIAPFDENILKIISLIQFRFLLHGYIGREVGGYRQLAKHIGHGAYCRKFKGKPQYEYKNLEIQVKNKFAAPSGDEPLIGNGFKGTRGKYRHAEFPQYQPQTKMKRSLEADIHIREQPYNKFQKYADCD